MTENRNHHQEREIPLTNGRSIIRTEEGIYFVRVSPTAVPILDDPEEAEKAIREERAQPITGEGGEKFYPVRCRVCGLHFHAAKSILHDLGMHDHGSGRCECGTFLNLRFDPETETMTSWKWEDHVNDVKAREGGIEKFVLAHGRRNGIRSGYVLGVDLANGPDRSGGILQ